MQTRSNSAASLKYPLEGERSFVRNRWYIAGFSHEVSRQPLERTILGIPVVLYRTEAGIAVAMYGLCPHRYYPLAMGKIEGDLIVCGYHGFTFEPSGKCVRVPSQDTGTGFRQPAYPLIERGPLIWIWMGDQNSADPDLLPPYEEFGLDQPGWRHSSYSLMPIKGRSQLLIDNLMDLTHLPYVHHHLPGGDVFRNTQMKTEERARSYRINRATPMPWNGFFDMTYGREHAFSGIAQAASITDFYGPELVRTSGPIVASIEGMESVPQHIGELHFIHGITPETETSTHYFGLMTRNFRIEDSGLDQILTGMDTHVRQQDVNAIEAVEQRVDAASRYQRELLVKSDAPAIKVRQKVQAMLDAEA